MTNAVTAVLTDVLTVSASSELGAGGAWSPLEPSPPSSNAWLPNNGQMPNWWQVQLRSAKVVTAYSILGSEYDAARSINTWTLSGSNDGSSWATLDTRSGVSGWSLNQQRDYTFSNTVAYSYYRINVTANNGSSYTSINGVWLGGVVLYPVWCDITGATATSKDQYDGSSGPETALIYPPIYGWTGPNGSIPEWWKIQFPAPLRLSGYSLIGSTFSGARSPNTFTFSGSNDNSAWTTLDTQSGITWGTSEQKYYALSPGPSYLYYRIDITAINGGGYPSIGAVKFTPGVVITSTFLGPRRALPRRQALARSTR